MNLFLFCSNSIDRPVHFNDTFNLFGVWTVTNNVRIAPLRLLLVRAREFLNTGNRYAVESTKFRKRIRIHWYGLRLRYCEIHWKERNSTKQKTGQSKHTLAAIRNEKKKRKQRLIRDIHTNTFHLDGHARADGFSRRHEQYISRARALLSHSQCIHFTSIFLSSLTKLNYFPLFYSIVHWTNVQIDESGNNIENMNNITEIIKKIR